MTIRKATEKDIPDMVRVTEAAKKLMRSHGNFVQWTAGYPDAPVWEADIRKGDAFVVEDNGRIVAAFAFIFGEDPTYGYIEGKWLNDKPYAALHRVASDGSCRGVLRSIVDYCSLRTADLRADTHEVNYVMKTALIKNGFARCGIIYLADGAPRVAFHKTCKGSNKEDAK